MGTVEVRLFGAPEVSVNGRPAATDTRKAIALLAVLAVESRPVRRDTLAGMLWPDATQERARASLRRTLSALRSLIGADAVVADREVIELDLDADAIDVIWFEARAADSPDVALALYRGTFLEGFSVSDAPEFEEWQRSETERFRLRVDALLDAMARDADPPAAAALARRRLELDPLNEAAARQAMAALGAAGDRAGAVVVYRELVRRLYDDLGVEPLAETMSVYETVRRGETTAPRSEPTPRARSTGEADLIGRDDVIQELSRALAQPGLVIVTGEPGIGRTRLVEEWAGGGADDVLLLRCHVGEQNLPYAPFARWLSDDSDSSLIQLFEQLAAALGLDPGGTIVIDDLDLADTGTMAFLTYVLHRRERFGWSVLGTWQGAHVTPDDASWDLLTQGRREGWATELVLERLGPADIADIARATGSSRAEVVQEIVHRAEGLPLLAVEFARLGDEIDSGAIPPAVNDLMRGRLASTSALARQVIEALAVIDRPADDRLLRSVAGRSDLEIVTAIDELVGSGIARGDGAIELTHHLIGVAALAGIPAARLRALHERAAEHLPAAEAASHMAEAGEPERAADLHVRAAGEAEAAHANRSAIHHLRAALALSRVDDVAVHLRIGDLETVEGRYEVARRAYEISAARSTGVDLALVELQLCRLALRSGDGEIAASHLDSARAELSPSHRDDRLRVELAVADALVALAQGRDATEAASHGIELAVELGDPATEAGAESAAALVAFRQGQPDRAGEHARRAARLAELAEAKELEAAAANLLGMVRAEEAEYEEAIEDFNRAREILQRYGDVHRLAAVHANLADALHTSGRDDEARQHQLESARLFSEVSGSPSEGRADLWFLTAW